MSQFTAGKNPPWARPAELFNVSAPGGLGGPSIGQPQVPGAQMMAHQQGLGGPTQTVYSVANSAPGITQAQFATAQMAAVALQHAQGQMPHGNTVLPQPGIAIPTSLSTSNVQPVSYPNLRPNAQQTQAHPPKQRVFTGTVTKLHENFGFVDEDVFFQKSCVKGAMPKVRERVLVEATYNPTMPFKWNATRIQLLPNQAGMGGIKGSNNASIPPPLGMTGLMGPGPLANIGGLGAQASVQELQQSQILAQANQGVSGLRGNIGGRRGDQMRYDRDKDRDRERDRERRDRIRQVRKRSRSPPPRRSSPPARPRSPVYRRPVRLAPRYVVQIPKISFDMKEANVVSVKTRYPNMYIPSDFFNTKFSWSEAFPHARSFQLGQNCCFHVMHKDVVPLSGVSATSEPADADHKFSAKVMLLSCPALEDLYHASCSLSEDPSETRENFQHPTRLLSFLVGLRGKGEPMAVGGPWSPSLDGANPEEDPRVLINTAIRTTRYLTNIDLSGCTKWYRFAEIRYLRSEETHKGRVVPARVETVVIFLPDVWSCSPTQLEWEGLQAAYKKLSKQTAEPGADEAVTEALLVEEDMEVVDESEQNEPTHFSELEPRSMKLVELRRELESRSLSPKGLRSQLIARLTKAMKSEQEQEKQEKEEEENKTAEAADKEIQEEVAKEESSKTEDSKDTGKESLTKVLFEGWVDEEEKKRKDDRDKDRDKAVLERRYTLPDTPSIIVHPSPTAKGGKFDCTVMSLSVLLDYRPEDNKEHSFEVSLFAELFNEMLMRDLGYCIYKALVLAPEKKEEDIKKEKDSKDKKKGDSHDKDSSSKDVKELNVKKPKLDDTDSKKEKDVDRKDKDSEKKEKETERKEKESDSKKEIDLKKEKEADSKKEKEKPKEKKDEKVKSKAGKEGHGAESVATGDGGGDKEEEEGEGGAEGEDMEEEGSDEEVEKEGEPEDKKPDVKKLRASWDRPRKRPKRVTVDPHLLLAFVYFDQNHTGHVLDKDLEEILHTTGLQLSRAQVRKLVQKVLVRDAVHYRKLTDRDPDKVIPESKVTANGTVPIGHSDSSPTGNLGLLQSHKRKVSVDETDPKPSTPTKSSAAKQQSGMVSYRGAMLDIKSLLQQLEKSEKNRAQMEARCQTAAKEISDLKSKCSKSEEKKDKVESELAKLQVELNDKTVESLHFKMKTDSLQEVLGKAKTMFKALDEEIEKAQAPVAVTTIKKEK